MIHTILNKLNAVLSSAYTIDRKISSLNRRLPLRKRSIPEAWMPTIRQHENWSLPQRTTEGSFSSSHNASNALDQTHQTWVRFVIHQSLTTKVVQIVRHSKSTLSPGEDLQTWQPISTTADRWGIIVFLSQCQQCFGSKPTKHEWGSVNRLVKTFSVRSKCRNQYQSDKGETR